jgi:membrane associated rhomboid family serine protease
MYDHISIVTSALLALNLLITYQGFKNRVFFNRYAFEVDPILMRRDYIRLVSSGFLHVNWMHIFFNMYALYAFGAYLEDYLGPFDFFMLYAGSLVGGSLLSLYIHRHHGDYRAVGASGAVCGVVFASIAMMPGIKLGFYLMPPVIPGWLFGLLYVLYTIYGIKSKKDNIGHEAHLGGGLSGLLLFILMKPAILHFHLYPILAMAVPSVIFLYLLWRRPTLLLVNTTPFRTTRNYNQEDRYNEQKKNRQEEIDRILEKLHQKGMESLTSREKQTLHTYSKDKR